MLISRNLARKVIKKLDLSASPANAGAIYFLLGTISGTTPGQLLGDSLLPLNLDGYFLYTLLNPGKPPLQSSLGFLDANGSATAFFSPVCRALARRSERVFCPI